MTNLNNIVKNSFCSVTALFYHSNFNSHLVLHHGHEFNPELRRCIVQTNISAKVSFYKVFSSLTICLSDHPIYLRVKLYIPVSSSDLESMRGRIYGTF